jgi:hypothetical protein
MASQTQFLFQVKIGTSVSSVELIPIPTPNPPLLAPAPNRLPIQPPTPLPTSDFRPVRSPSERTRSSRSSGPFAPLMSEPSLPYFTAEKRDWRSKHTATDRRQIVSRDVTTGSDRHNTQTFPWFKAITLRSRLSDCI